MRILKIARFISLFVAFAGIIVMDGCRKQGTNTINMNGPGGAEKAPLFTSNIPAGTYVANEVIVQFKANASEQERNDAFSAVSGSVKELVLTEAMKRAGDPGFYVIHTPLEVKAAISKLTELVQVKYAEPDWLYTYGSVSNDPYYINGSLWGMTANSYGCGASTAWSNNHTGSSSVVVGVIDEGIMNTHEDIAANCWTNPYEIANNKKDDDGNGYVDDVNGWNFAGNSNVIFDKTGDDHGTHVAGTIGAVGGNGKGVAGVNWNVTMISCKFLGKNGGTTANAVKAVDYLTDMKTRHSINIVASNNSWGGGGFSQALKDAIDRANAKDILFIAAAGNSTSNNDAVASYPSNYTSPNVIAVAAINSSGGLSYFSNWGATTVDLGAPGEAIWSSVPKQSGNSAVSSYASYSGTSMATPHVTGAAALFASTHAGISASDLRDSILARTVPTSSLSGKCVTGGRLDVSGF